MEPTVALQLAGRNYDVLIDTGFSGLLLAYAYPDHLYDTSTFYNNAEFETPPSLLPEISLRKFPVYLIAENVFA